MPEAVMPAWATAGSQTRNPVTTAAIAKRMSLRIALLLSRLFLLGHKEFGAAYVVVRCSRSVGVLGRIGQSEEVTAPSESLGARSSQVQSGLPMQRALR